MLDKEEFIQVYGSYLQGLMVIAISQNMKDIVSSKEYGTVLQKVVITEYEKYIANPQRYNTK